MLGGGATDNNTSDENKGKADLPADDVYMATLAEQAERYEEMVEYIKKVASELPDGQDLSVEARNLLSVAYKNTVGARRASMRIVNSIESKESEKASSPNLPIAQEYKVKVEAELESICNDLLALLDSSLIARGEKTDEASTFYLKMKADYHRYLAEFASVEKRAPHAARAEEAYTAASTRGAKLAPTHPIRLGLALNYSVFLYEVQNKTKEACELAKSGFDDAIAELDKLHDEEAYKDSTLIMQLLRDNLTIWTNDEAE